MKKRWIIVLGITVMTILGLGVKFYMDEEKLNKEMKQVVYSDEAKEVFEKRLTNMDGGGASISKELTKKLELKGS
ncbi:DUF1310 family protein [Listeria marthii]|uniref:DUF1310 family protein n=1 Tax=Listeria marthii TaxID=529731 RepID=A0A842CMJ8_9LIST|nr:DUF1310 family protein [Listeria marthii]MBC2012468.1 DUF1310 family protein [Listeria marthii]MBC2073945.1 DUF1310 family protein [Listeria marthii]MBC2076612.1 DUF1310 family protein [Listeria marthii]MBF2514061.1 DUF1310 family protein [Listeria marthii]